MSTNVNKTCCVESLKLEKCEKYVVLQFSSPVDIKITPEESIWGRRLRYISHVEQQDDQVFFRHEHKILYQDQKGDICESKFGNHQNVTILSILFDEDDLVQKLDAVESMVYGKQAQKFLQKQYLSVINLEKYQEKNPGS